mmetsp:Transcript_22697/g.89772  ORF Transcript_22697/g.89772 Transcript_22697/m.89772 type:complete len:434 (-) Transcript_22697:134-1435(-)
MHDVAELVEEGDDVIMLEEGRAVADLGGKVGEHAVDGPLGAPRLEQMEDGCVVVLAVARVHVQVEVAHLRARLRVVNHEQTHVLVPGREARQLREAQPQQLLVDLQRAVHHHVDREVLLDLLLVHAVLLLEEEVVVEGEVPGVELAVKFFAAAFDVAALQLEQALLLLARGGHQLRVERCQELHHRLRAPCHPPGADVVREVVVAQELRQLLALARRLLHQLQVVAERRAHRLLHPPPRLRNLAVGHDGYSVGVLEGDLDLPFGGVGVRDHALLEEGLGQALELGPREAQAGVVVGDVCAKVGAESGVLVEQRLETGALLLCELEAAAAVVGEEGVEEVAAVGRQRGDLLLLRCEGLEAAVDACVHAHGHALLAEPHASRRRRLAHRRLRAAVLQELGLAKARVRLVVRRPHQRLHAVLERELCRRQRRDLIE